MDPILSLQPENMGITIVCFILFNKHEFLTVSNYYRVLYTLHVYQSTL